MPAMIWDECTCLGWAVTRMRKKHRLGFGARWKPFGKRSRRLKRKGRSGSACFIVPKNCISIREPYSEERRRAASERAKQAGYKPPVRGTVPKSE